MINILTKGQQAKTRLDEIKSLYKIGGVSYDEARKLAFEPLKILNEEMAKIAKKYGRKHKMVEFTGFIR